MVSLMVAEGIGLSLGLNFEQSAAASHVHEASIKVSAVCLEGRYGAIHAASFQLVTTHRYFHGGNTGSNPVGDANIFSATYERRLIFPQAQKGTTPCRIL